MWLQTMSCKVSIVKHSCLRRQKLPLPSHSCWHVHQEVACCLQLLPQEGDNLGPEVVLLVWALDMQVGLLPLIWLAALFLTSMRGTITHRLLYDNILIIASMGSWSGLQCHGRLSCAIMMTNSCAWWFWVAPAMCWTPSSLLVSGVELFLSKVFMHCYHLSVRLHMCPVVYWLNHLLCDRVSGFPTDSVDLVSSQPCCGLLVSWWVQQTSRSMHLI